MIKKGDADDIQIWLKKIVMLAVYQREIITNADIYHSGFSRNDEEEFLTKFRNLVRSLHSCGESVLAFMKSEALSLYQRNEVMFTERELEKLKGAKWSKKRECMVPVKLKFTQNARLAIRLYGQATNGASSESRKLFQFPKRIEEWSSLRNRVTHPKSLEDYMISSRERKNTQIYTLWLMDLISWVVDTELILINDEQYPIGEVILEMDQMISKGDVPTSTLYALRGELIKIKENPSATRNEGMLKNFSKKITNIIWGK